MLVRQAGSSLGGCLEEVRRGLAELGTSMALSFASTREISEDFHEIELNFLKIGEASTRWNGEIMECRPDLVLVSKNLADLLREASWVSTCVADYQKKAIELKEESTSYKKLPKPKGEARRKMFADARLKLESLLKLTQTNMKTFDGVEGLFKEEVPLAFDEKGAFRPEGLPTSNLRTAWASFFTIQGQVKGLNQLLEAMDEKWTLRAEGRDLEAKVQILIEERELLAP